MCDINITFTIDYLVDSIIQQGFENNYYWLSKMVVMLPMCLLYSSLLFSIAIVNVALNRKNILLMLLSVELMLLAASLNFIFFSITTHDPLGQVYALLIITIAAAESAVGLGLLIAAFRLKKSISFDSFNTLRG